MNKRVLICGATSFVANGFKELMESEGCIVDTFGRKNGNYLDIDKCSSLAPNYDVVVNFAVLKDQSIDDNIQYLRSLVKMCQEHGVKKLIHFSSVMVYSRRNKVIDENTPIESSDTTIMKGYGKIKIATDEYFNSIVDSAGFQIVRVRPGFVLAPGVPCPFIKHIFGPVSVILGNKKSTLPIVRRDDIHKALLKIISLEKNLPVYLFYPNDGMTKYRYAKKTVGGLILTLPKWLFDGVPFLFAKMKLIPWSFYSRFEGMFTSMDYSSKLTEETLQMKFN